MFINWPKFGFQRRITRDQQTMGLVMVRRFATLLGNLVLSQEHIRNTAADRVGMRTVGTNHVSFRYMNLNCECINNILQEGRDAKHEETLRLAEW